MLGGIPGPIGQYFEVVSSGTTVISTVYGTEAENFTNGYVNFIVVKDDSEPFLVEAASFACAGPSHFRSQDTLIAVFCDGSYDAVPQVNATYFVVDEKLFAVPGGATATARGNASPILLNRTIMGTHHGQAFPFRSDQVLHSLTTTNRIARANESTEEDQLGSTFEVTSFQGEVLHRIANLSNPSESCIGFHGSSFENDTVVAGCSARDSGGLLVIQHNDQLDEYHTSHLGYPIPEKYVNHRVSEVKHHYKNPYYLADYADWTTYELIQLMAFQIHSPSLEGEGSSSESMNHGSTGFSNTVLAESTLLPLNMTHCFFGFELAEGEMVLVWLPTGTLRLYTLGDPDVWNLAAELQG
jgi:hypothetical protein